jgi:hypothetical protein
LETLITNGKSLYLPLEPTFDMGQSNSYRTFKNGVTQFEPVGFIDGDFIETFNELSESDIQKVLQGTSEFEKLDLRKEDIQTLLEEMGWLH